GGAQYSPIGKGRGARRPGAPIHPRSAPAARSCDTSPRAPYSGEMAQGSRVLVTDRPLAWFAPAAELDWGAVYAEQLPRVYNFFRYRVGEGPEAEDLTSVTFEKAWRARGRYRRDLGRFTSWLFAIARNVATDHFRSVRHHAPLEAAEGVAA